MPERIPSGRITFPEPHLRKLLFIRIGKGDAEQVEEVFGWAASGEIRKRLANATTRAGDPALFRAVRGLCISAGVVEVLLKHGADPTATGRAGLTPLDHARRRLLKYEGKPRKKPRRSPSLTPGGEVILNSFEHRMLDEMADLGQEFLDTYLEERRKAANRVFDPRGELERIVELLEPIS